MKKSKPDQYTLSDIFQEMELELIKSMKRNLGRHEEWERNLGIKWEQWQSSKLRALQRYKASTRKIVKSYHPQIENTIKEVMTNTFKEEVKNELQVVKDLGIESTGTSVDLSEVELEDNDFFQVNNEKLDIVIEEMQGTFTNSDGLVMRKMDNVYMNVLNKEVFKVSAGAKTIQQSVDDATKSFLEKGLDCIIYKNGRRVNIATYAEMYLRTSNAKASLLAHGAVRDKLGVYTVRVSQHMNCSELCLDYQNTILIDDVFTNVSHEDAVKMSRKTGYSRLSVAIENGLFHPNCRHTLSTWFPDKSSLPKALDIEQKDRALSNYKKEQEQRGLESKIREWKRVAEGSLVEEDAAKAKKKVSKYQAELRDHIKDNPHLRRNYWRERANKQLGLTKQGIQRVSQDKPYEDVTKQWLENVDKNKKATVTENNYFEKDGVLYDESNAKLDTNFGEEETNMADWLKETFNDDVELIPRVEYPRSVKTPDFIFKDEGWDLKTIRGSGRQTIYQSVRKQANQSSNFIFDISNSEIDMNSFTAQVNDLFIRDRTSFVKKVICKKGNELLQIKIRK